MDSKPIIIVTTTPVTPSIKKDIERIFRQTSKVPTIQQAPIRIIDSMPNKRVSGLGYFAFNSKHTARIFNEVLDTRVPCAGTKDSILFQESRIRVLTKWIEEALDPFYMEAN